MSTGTEFVYVVTKIWYSDTEIVGVHYSLEGAQQRVADEIAAEGTTEQDYLIITTTIED